MANFKFGEDAAILELHQYIESTYSQHYASDNGVQYMDLVMSDEFEQALGFLKHNSGKYISRLGKKDGLKRKDIIKAAHYLILMMCLLSQHSERED